MTDPGAQIGEVAEGQCLYRAFVIGILELRTAYVTIFSNQRKRKETICYGLNCILLSKFIC